MREKYKVWLLWLEKICGWVLSGVVATVYLGTPVHELGHRLMMKFFGMTIVASGWDFVRSAEPPNIPVLVAGPLAAIVFGILIILLGRYIPNEKVRWHCYAVGSGIAAISGVTNLLPVHVNTDGYKAMQLLGWV